MVFNSYTFLIFLAIVLLLHSLPLSWKVKKANLLVASYLFYAAWNPPFVLLLWLSTVVDWFAARRMHAAETSAARRGYLWLSLVSNLGMLALFKYYNFLADSFVAVAAQMGVTYVPPAMDIILPVGISFYTFQTLSYTLDVYRRQLAPAESFLDFAMYVTFFPQLVAGPIVRARDFLPQCTTPRQATSDQFAWGLCLLVCGLFQKVVLADNLFAPVVEQVYDAAPRDASFVGAWCGTLAFAGQIFCDFAGYSTCAIGVAMCLGFALPDNFRTPYAARGFSDFWRRWHISLSEWLRDYLYIPLGGNRRGPVRTAINLAITMLLGGLWHGASWTFVAWGGLHALYLIVEHRVQQTRLATWNIWRTTSGRVGLTLLTFFGVCLAWVFFRAANFGDAFALLSAMFGMAVLNASALPTILVLQALIPISLLCIWQIARRDRSLESWAERAPAWAVSAALAGLGFLVFTAPGADRAFIYFQF